MSSTNESTRTRILKSAWSLLENGGGSAVRMSDIAKAAKISRQALYLHFPNRAELLIATTLYLDEVYKIDDRLAASRASANGIERLAAWVEAWGNYIPSIYGVAKALMAIQDTDAEAREAWAQRMDAVRHGCTAAIKALATDGTLSRDLSQDEATDMLAMMLSVRNWEHLRQGCEWSQDRYISAMQDMAHKTLVRACERAP